MSDRVVRVETDRGERVETTVESGQDVFDSVSQWFRQYLNLLDPVTCDVYALWAIGSWIYDKYRVWPFLTVTASVPGAGKSTALKLLLRIVRGCQALSINPTPAALLRKIREMGGKLTTLWDEAEATAADKKTFLSEMVNSAYQAGGVIERSSGDSYIAWRSFHAIAFAMIGDPTATVRDRSIVTNHTRGSAEKNFDQDEVFGVIDQRGVELKAQIIAMLANVEKFEPFIHPELAGRDQQIWSSMFGLAKALHLNADTFRRLTRYALDNAGQKLAPKRRTQATQSDAEAAAMDLWATKALRDLKTIVKQAKDGKHKGKYERGIYTVVAVERMKKIEASPWRTYAGKGLDQQTLVAMVSRFGLHAADLKLGKDGRVEPHDQITSGVGRGFYAADILKAEAK
jgi:hypothetical protein